MLLVFIKNSCHDANFDFTYDFTNNGTLQFLTRKNHMKAHKYTNELIHESSPYLLQHAHNPVNWMPWRPNSLKKAKDENKLLLISIGYAACHWCHVMEHETFEDESAAQLMNKYFVCIKVDREERPDVDQVYMTAVQLITRRGGWPLNCIAIPDGSPIWGGTYFQKESWMNALEQISVYWIKNPEKTIEYANQLKEGIIQTTIAPVSGKENDLSEQLIHSAVTTWKNNLDFENGGNQGAPKFMIPNNLDFLLRYSHQFDDEQLSRYVERSLQKMAFGGLYDQVGGGFARYSTDNEWKVPHFEKMLYDNAQLISLYSNAYRKYKNPLYRQVVTETIEFLKRELLSPENGFYSSLDADSDGEEGKFYVWQKIELQTILQSDYELFAEVYNINSYGHWEDGNYILIRIKEFAELARKFNISEEQLIDKISGWKQILLEIRSKRNRPGLDDKILTSWNSMTIKGLTDAWKAFGNIEYLNLAKTNARFLKSNLQKNGQLLHSYKNGESKINGFLEDYAFTIEALISLFEVSGEKEWLDQATILLKSSLKRFFNKEQNFFYFTPSEQTDLITRTIEVHDNVIPSSNSTMAEILFKLGYLSGNIEYIRLSEKMSKKIAGEIENYPSGFSKWLQHILNMKSDYFELAICGENAFQLLHKINRDYLPNILLCAGTNENDLPLLENRFVKGQTLIYVCQNNACKLPVKTVDDALKLINLK